MMSYVTFGDLSLPPTYFQGYPAMVICGRWCSFTANNSLLRYVRYATGGGDTEIRLGNFGVCKEKA